MRVGVGIEVRNDGLWPTPTMSNQQKLKSSSRATWAIGGPTASSPHRRHTAGRDPIGDAIGSVAESVEQHRAQRAQAAAQYRGSSALANLISQRVAQVVQATKVEFPEVLELIQTEVRTATQLRILDHTPGSADKPDIFDGYLRLRRPPTRRRIELRVYPSASGNLTVLELLPRRGWMPQTKRYLQAGVPAITDLTDRIEAAAQAPL